ncbi:uncharacterized protein LOC144879468 isoform X1 [Branchiostoma floridae x Branchiostoma japonicum]
MPYAGYNLQLQQKVDVVYRRFVEIGRVAFVRFGQDEGKLCAVVDIVDQNRALVDGPNIRRQAISFKFLHLTPVVITIGHGCGTSAVKKAWEKEGVEEKWRQSTWYKKLQMKATRKQLSDFDRFKLMKVKQRRSWLIKMEMGRLKKAQNK